jgi:arylsulfatase A-like enzyme
MRCFKTGLSAVALVSVGLFLCLSTSLEAGQKPNIVLAMADDQGWRDVAYNADPDRGLQTPNMDQMAREGIRFNRFYSSSPNCAPTRASVLTGRHCERSGVFNPGFAMPARELTIAKILKKAGYTTAHFGKWHLGPVKAGSKFDPHAQGFDYYLSHYNHFNTDPALSRNGAQPESFTGDGSEVIVGEALKYLDSVKASGKPFFLVVWFGSPHLKHIPLQKYKDLYSSLPEEWQNYYGEITGIDQAMGNLRSGLKVRGLDSNTLIWYTSDNGSFTPADTIAGLRGCKGSMWEGGIRVPGIIVWPGRITNPMETEMVANTLDIMPTLLDLLGITLENHTLDGMSLLPLLEGKNMTTRSKAMPFWRNNDLAKQAKKVGSDFTKEELTDWWHTYECPSFKTAQTEDFGGWAAWSEGKWKLHNPKGGRYELYDIEADPAESNEVSSQYPEVVKDLAAKLKDWQCAAEVSLTGADYKN